MTPFLGWIGWRYHVCPYLAPNYHHHPPTHLLSPIRFIFHPASCKMAEFHFATPHPNSLITTADLPHCTADKVKCRAKETFPCCKLYLAYEWPFHACKMVKMEVKVTEKEGEGERLVFSMEIAVQLNGLLVVERRSSEIMISHFHSVDVVEAWFSRLTLYTTETAFWAPLGSRFWATAKWVIS